MALVALKGLVEHVFRRSRGFSWLVVMAVVVAPWIAYSWVVFGQVFPETLGQKMWQGASGFWGTGLIYLRELLTHFRHSGWWLVIGAPIGAVLMSRDRSPLVYLLLFAVIQRATYCVLNVPPYPWYFAVFDLTLRVCAVYAIGVMARYLRLVGQPRVLVVTAAVLLVLAGVDLAKGVRALPGRPTEEAYAQAIRAIDETYGPESIGALEVGVIGFGTRRHVVDLVGLTSPRGQFLTEDRMDAFYGEPPDLLLLHDPPSAMERAIFTDSRFEEVYEPRETFPTPVRSWNTRLYVAGNP